MSAPRRGRRPTKIPGRTSQNNEEEAQRAGQSRRPGAPSTLHPFCAPVETLRRAFGFAPEGEATLRLPTRHNQPQPSPNLIVDWKTDSQSPLHLAAWTVKGLALPTSIALQALLNLGVFLNLEDQHEGRESDGERSTGLPRRMHVLLGDDAIYWHNAANLALEVLAAGRMVPVLAAADENETVFHARWLPVLDGPNDAMRLALLEMAMPPLCRAAVPRHPSRKDAEPEGALTPRDLLYSFLNTSVDSLARQWGRSQVPYFPGKVDDPAHRWILALFSDDPTVKAAPAQLRDLANSQRAWLRNLHVAGDSQFRIAFRLEAPGQSAAREPGLPVSPDTWTLYYLVQARDDPSLLIPAEDIWQVRGSVLNQLGRRFENPHEKLLAGLGYAARLFSPIAESLKSNRPSRLMIDTQQAYTFLRHTAPLLQEAGFGLLVPPWWNQPGARLGVRLHLKPAGEPRGDGSTAKSIMNFNNLVRFQWELSVGDTRLTRGEFNNLVALKSPLVQIRGQWVQLDAEQIEAAIRFYENQEIEGEVSLLEAIQMNQGGVAQAGGLPVGEVVSEGWLREWLERFNQDGGENAHLLNLPQPAGLNGTLRPYQRFGFSWLNFLREWGLGACLADDMGLGKTIQALALLLNIKESEGKLPGPSLLVCPTSVVTNWEREIRKFAPSLTSMVHQGKERLRGDELVKAARRTDLVLTSYALARLDADTLQRVKWLNVIVDEAQNIKNPAAKQSQAVRSFKAGFRMALTGTPVENRLSELWSIMHFLNPGYLGARQAFRSEFAMPIERYHDEQATQRLKKLVGPFILRRVKTDPRVIQDLPEKVETKVFCNLTEEQATLYQAVVQDAMNKIGSSEGMERRGLILSMLMQLKQVCNHPAQFLHQARRGEGAEELTEEDLAERSGKLERLEEMLEEIRSVGDRALLFTQFAEMGHLLFTYLNRDLGIPSLYLHGGVPPRQRDALVSRFQEEHGPSVFILSLKAGGTGLNLTRACHVFHFDRWWNPAVEDQATDRAFRIGQVRNVQVHKFVTVGTLEEKIDEMIESKKGLAQAVVGSGESLLTELSTADLREVVELRLQ